jgi:3-hydroxyacyl-CoA dehydrogenase
VTAAGPSLRRVAVVGTGVIGAGWAALLLAHGHDVVAHDPAAGAADRLRDAVAGAWPVLTRLGLAPGASPDRLTVVDTVGAAVGEADFVQESGPEDPATKAALLAEVDAAAPEHVVVASSSSGLMPSVLQEMAPRAPGRVLVGHPFAPAHLVPLVEVVPGRASTAAAVETAIALYRSLGKRPVLVRREVPGHVTNRLQAALWREAYSLVERGVATVADIDTAISNGPGLRWALLGPLVGQHLSGGAGGLARTLEHLGPPAQEWMDDLGAPQLTPDLVARLVRGVDDELAGVDQAEMVAERDALLVELLERKRQCRALP